MGEVDSEGGGVVKSGNGLCLGTGNNVFEELMPGETRSSDLGSEQVHKVCSDDTERVEQSDHPDTQYRH